jgi:hypothetical protein
VEREYALMQNQLHGVSWIPETFELFPVSKRVFCYSMEELGMSLRHMRLAHDQGQVWPWITLGTIGAHTLELVKKMHTEKGIFKSRLRTKSWFLPHIPRGEIALPTFLKMIDFGEARKVSHPRAPAKILEEVRQQVISLRYLLDGDDKFYSWKNYDYKEEEICADVPEVYCDAIKYLKSLNQREEIDYDSLIGMMVQIVRENGGVYTGAIDWEPLVQAHGVPPGKLKAKEKKDKKDQPHAEARPATEETSTTTEETATSAEATSTSSEETATTTEETATTAEETATTAEATSTSSEETATTAEETATTAEATSTSSEETATTTEETATTAEETATTAEATSTSSEETATTTEETATTTEETATTTEEIATITEETALPTEETTTTLERDERKREE